MRSLAIALLLLTGLSHAAHAERKRVVVFAFDGPNATKVRAELIQLVQRSHRVIALESWNKAAKTLSATRSTPANVRKVARKLAVDAVIEATVIERRSGFRVRIRLRDGVTGLSVEALDVTMTGTRFNKASVRDIKGELIDVISSLDDEDEDRPRRRRRKG
jgi:hypothetical protein